MTLKHEFRFEMRRRTAFWRINMFRKNWIASPGRFAIMRVLLLALVGILAVGWARAESSVPAVVVSSAGTTALGLTDHEAGVALDSCGNIYAIANFGGQITEIPAGGGSPTILITAAGDNWTTNGLWIDSSRSNLYVTLGSGQTKRYPIVNCAVQTGNAVSIGLGNLGAISWWSTTSAVASDAAGNVFIATNNACCAPPNELLEEDATASNGKTLLGSLPAPIDSMTVDAASNIYFVSGGALYELPHGADGYASSAVTIGGPFTKATGVSIDPAGNLYVTDNGASKIYEIPIESGVLNPADQFLVASGVTATSAVAFGLPSDFYFTNNGSTVYDLKVGYASLGTAAVGGSNSTGTLGVVFNTAVSPATIGFVGASDVFSAGSASTCAAGSYAKGDACTVAVGFAPSASGLSRGALVLTDSNGASLGAASVTGIGLGAGLTADPGTQTAMGSGFKAPASVAIDALGNTYIADPGAGAVWQIPAGNGTPASIGTGLNVPAGVAVDAAGNVFIADTGNNQVVEIPANGAVLDSSAQTVVVSSASLLAGSALNRPSGLTVDLAGDLYIADTGNNRVVYLPRLNNWNANQAVTVGSGLSSPLATAVTPSGLVYIADSGNGKLYSVPYPTTPQTLVAAGLNNPSALAVDAAGDLFVVDSGNAKVLRIPNIAGTLVSANAMSVAAGVADPYGLALDIAGNLYVSDSVNAAAFAIARTNAKQSFGKWSPNTPSSALAFTIENSGNQTLTFGEALYTATGDTADFAISSGSNACAAGASVNTGASCTISAVFTAPDLGSFSETLAISSNAANAAAPQVTFTGIGAQTTSTTTTLAITSPAGNPVYGQAITLTATVASVSDTPTGNVQLLVDGNQVATAALSNGVANFSLANGLPGGSHTLQAVYPGGDAGFVTFSHSASEVVDLVVTRAATTAALDFATLYINPASQPAGTALTLTATITPAVAGIPSGSVTFTITEANGNKLTQAQPLSPVAGGAFQAVYSYTPSAPANAAVGTASITAAYAGDTNFAASASSNKSFYVSPASGSVVETASALAITASTTSSSSVSFTATTYGGWNGLIGFGCLASSLPANTRCVFSPGQIQVLPSTSTSTANNVPVLLAVTVNQPPQTPTASKFAWWLALPAGLLLFFARRRFGQGSWNAVTLMIGVLVLGIAAAGLTACGSTTPYRTHTGTTNITVYAWADPYTAMPSAGNANPATKSCGINAGSGKPDPSLAPCSQTTFQVAVTVK